PWPRRATRSGRAARGASWSCSSWRPPCSRRTSWASSAAPCSYRRQLLAGRDPFDEGPRREAARPATAREAEAMNGAGRRPDPEPASAPRPWEEPGAVRRACAPHRANLLAVLGKLSLALGLLSALFGVPLLVGLPVSLATVLLAGLDLERMAAGAMDPR